MQIKHILILAVMLSTIQLSGQATINSPLTRLGLGENILNRGHHLELMGGLYAGFNHASLVNTVNPASLGFLKLTAFDIGTSFGVSNLEVNDRSQRTNIGGLHHLTLAFPLRNTISEVLERKDGTSAWAMALDLRSNSRVGYDITVADSIAEVGSIRRDYVGSGGTYTFGWINSYRYKNLSIGADIGVLFGNIQNRREVFFLDLLNPANDRFEDDINITSFRWKLGLQYKYQLNKKEENSNRKRYLDIGVYGHSNKDLNTKSNSLYYTKRLISGVRDTLINNSEVKGGGVNPGIFGFGFTIQPSQQVMLGMNVELNQMGDFEVDQLEAGMVQNGYRVGIGGSYLPDENAFGQYFKRVLYKGGLQYIKDGRIIDGEDVTQIKANFGMTMPFYYLRQVSFVHLGLEYIKTNANTINDNYYGVTLGVTFNDNKWFLQRKFN